MDAYSASAADAAEHSILQCLVLTYMHPVL